MNADRTQPMLRSTTILTVRRAESVAIGGDGQVSLGETAVKHDASKIRSLANGTVLCGFAGSAGDAFGLLERFNAKIEQHPGNLRRAAVELARDWRVDRALRRLQAMIVAASIDTTLMVSGAGDVIEPTDGVIGIGSGGMYATAAARALLADTDLPPDKIVDRSLRIAADICVYTNQSITIEQLG